MSANLINTMRGKTKRKEYSSGPALPFPPAFLVQVLQGTILWVFVFRSTDFWNWKVARVYFTESKKMGL